ncbi:Bax inhibitor-1/YccA family protein [Hyphomonas sp.]|uniref:Bax inhibitor-1/YccA family protein n=1 Tax=Hyphomonas sp. TaxID=87 RepID=UPI0033410F20
MNDFNRTFGAIDTRSADTSVNVGLRAFMLGVYQKLALGIALAGVLAFVVGANFVPALTQAVLFSPLRFVIQFAPLVLILGSAFLMKRPSPLATGIMYWTIVSLLGLSLSIWVYAATNNVEMASRAGRTMSPEFMTIAKAFFLTSASFGALSLFGYTTKMDLKPIGVFATFAIFGLILLSLVSLLFPPSGFLEVAIMGGVLAISGILIAYDTQSLKMGYFENEGDTRSLAVMTNFGALSFFISFYNIFTILMSMLSSND